MSEFKIKTSIELDDEKAKAQLKSLQTNAKENNIKLNVEMNTSSLNNLKQLETVLGQINKLSRETQNGLFGSKSTKGSNSSVNSLLSEYQKLINKKNSIEKQMSKTTNIQSYAVLEKQLSSVLGKIQTVGSALEGLQGKAKIDSSSYENMQRTLASTFQKIQGDIQKAQNQIAKFKQTHILDEKQSAIIDSVSKQLNNLSNIKLENLSFRGISKLLADFQSVQSVMANLKIPEINSKVESQFNSMQKSVDGFINKLKQLSGNQYADKNVLGGLLSQAEKLKSLDLKNLTGDELKKAIADLENLELRLKEVQSAANVSKTKSEFQFNFDKAISDLKRLKQSALELGQSTSGIEKLEKELMQLANLPLDQKVSKLEQIQRAINNMNKSTTALSSSGKGVNKFFNDFTRSFSYFTLGNMAAMQLQNAIRGVVSTYKELDATMTDLKKVADPVDINSVQKLDEIRSKANQTAKEVGMTTSQVQESIAASLQAGIGGMQESIAAARQSMILANVGDMSVDDASSAVNTIINGFRIEPLKEMEVQVGNTTKKTTELTAAMDMLNCLAC
ncbi:phage tail tape measure protein [Clostridioides difficile]|nr:phage tail tape measure protein [Clostridioides difficile]MCZ1068675.1 phage tail tape measure protein [Clostridioides difficile]MDC2934727.1 phage tail tape measure protein [Clostridioides difficile]MDS6381764.1 phage tail tape measure protein [Clostridioides difficile]HBF7547493.1 phage tail tape measure protein [Clostridioides difficile]